MSVVQRDDITMLAFRVETGLGWHRDMGIGTREERRMLSSGQSWENNDYVNNIYLFNLKGTTNLYNIKQRQQSYTKYSTIL